MKVISIVLIGFLIFGCSSKKQSCKCPYQAEIKSDRDKKDFFEPINFQFNNLLLAKKHVDIQLYRPLKLALLDIKKEIPLYSEIIETALKYKGVRYRTGGTSAKGMDCSGLVYKCYSNLGISLPRRSVDMAVKVQDISISEAKKGDLIFFKTNRRKAQINHVGIVIEVNGKEIKFIHASIKKGVTVSSTFENYYAKTFVKVGRVLDV